MRKPISILIVTVAGIYTLYAVVKRFFFEDTEWLHSTPDWILFVGAWLILSVVVVGLMSLLFRGSALDAKTKREIHRITKE